MTKVTTISPLQQAAEDAREALIFGERDDWGYIDYRAVAEKLLAAVDEDLAYREIESRCLVSLGGKSFTWIIVRPCDDGTWKSVGDKGKHVFDSSVAALKWVREQEAKK